MNNSVCMKQILPNVLLQMRCFLGSCLNSSSLLYKSYDNTQSIFEDTYVYDVNNNVLIYTFDQTTNKTIGKQL